ncbi:hypothetical protein ACIPLR_06105 [Herbaspirillum huttiense]|uniref:hypothetical protein n=1 Tax=Herbaspirillum huttiense TaxID=863372 RepID=UPI00381E3ABB
MSDVIEHRDAGNGDAAREVHVGRGGTPVSLKMYQDIYHQVTGRTEQIRKRYTENLLLEFSNIQQLHYKIMQLCDVHNIVARNEVISVFHDKERKEQFTSFERFSAYNSNATSPTVSVVLRYNFSIIPAGIQKPQEYVVTVRLVSRVALLDQIERETPPFIRGHIIGMVAEMTAEVTVEYADYVIARGFVEAFDEWVEGCDVVPRKQWLRFARRWSHIIPVVTPIITVMSLAYFALAAIPAAFASPIHLENTARFFVLYGAGACVGMLLGKLAGEAIEYAIDTYPILSYLKLNKGDVKLVEKFSAQRWSVGVKFAIGIALQIAVGIASSKLEKLI